MNDKFSNLGIDDTDFLVASFVARSPRHMMIRELVMNAIEAAGSSERAKTIEISGLEIGGVRKLAIRNSGRGMTRDELYRMCDLGTSIRKIKGIDGNFGMGGKISSLASNPAGVRYRSCASGRVYEVVLGGSNGKYGRQWIKSKSGIADIREVTDMAADEGLPTDEDWTEVVLYGAKADQDTVIDPYREDGFISDGWISKALEDRFFRLPPGVEIRLDSSLGAAAHGRDFRPLSERLSRYTSRHEAVSAGKGLKLRYAYIDPTSSDPGAPPSGRVGMVFRNELFDVADGSPWAYNAPSFGIAFGAKNVILLIEFDDDYPVFPEQYRQFLCYEGGAASRVTSRDFARPALANRPRWLVERLGELSAACEATYEIRTSLNELARQLSTSDAAVEPPRVFVLRDLAELRERWLDARAARYEPDTNELFVNATYPSITRFRDDLLASLPEQSRKDVRLQKLAVEFAEEAALTRLARTLVYLNIRALSKAWTPGNRERAMSGEALSIVADDLEMSVAQMRERLAAALVTPSSPNSIAEEMRLAIVEA